MAVQPRSPNFQIRDEVIARLRVLRPVLESEGVSQIFLFGSIARGDNDNSSDIDLIVSFEASRRADIFDLSAIKTLLTSQFDRPIDLGTRDSLHPERHMRIIEELVPVF
jgi:predicted nucleotidyltransferase